MSSTFLPITKKEALERGWDQLDFVYIIGEIFLLILNAIFTIYIKIN